MVSSQSAGAAGCLGFSRADGAAAARCCHRAVAPRSLSSRLEGTPLKERLDGLEMMQQEYEVAGQTLRMVCPADPDAVLERYVESDVDGDPYWTRVWPSAIALARELLQRPQLVAGLRVADLGAGLGVAGIAAALAGALSCVVQ